MTRPHLARIRENTAYPAFRGIVTLFTYIGYSIAALVFIGTIIGGRGIGDSAIGLAVGVAIAILAKVGQELSLMVADIADAVISTGEAKE